MSEYGDWTYYQAAYGTIQEKSVFDRLNVKASLMLDTMSGRRAEHATGYKAERLKDAACQLIELIAVQEESGAGRGVSSVSNDGYSETYTARTPEEAHEMLRQCAFAALSGTGLMGAL